MATNKHTKAAVRAAYIRGRIDALEDLLAHAAVVGWERVKVAETIARLGRDYEAALSELPS